jgi:hypothetical protein
MVLRDLRNRLTASVQELDRARLQARYQGLGLTAIGEAPSRTPLRVAGEVQETRTLRQAQSPAVHVTLDDGTGRLIAVFSGRRRIPGLGLGRGVVLEGVARDERGHLVMLNPAYTLLDPASD